jgi:PRTRC genetic system protein B
VPRKTIDASPPLFPNNAHAGLVFTDDGQIIYCSQDKLGIQRKGLSPETVASVFAKAPVWSGYLPRDVWCWGKANGAEWIAIVIPPSVQTLILVEGNNTTRMTIPLPSLVFAGTRLDYFVWAVGEKDWARDPRNAVYHAPFPNVNDKGLVCFGTNILPPCSPQTIREAWQLFLDSPFNAHSIGEKSQQFPDDIRELWQELSQEKIERFPCDDLVAMGNSIGRVLEQALMRND